VAKNTTKMLEERLKQNLQKHVESHQTAEFSEGREYILVQVHTIEPNPYQPRRIFPEDELQKLATSIAEVGLLEPILLRKVEDRYQIAAGERRWRAHKLLNKPTIGAIVTSISDSDMAVFALAENVDREDLSDYEIGIAIRQIENLFPTKKKLAESLGMNREDMYRYFSFDDLPEFIRNDLNNNPRLLSRSAASDIRRIGQNNETPLYDTLLAEAWGLLLNGDLEQTKIAGYIIRKLKAEEEGNKDCHIQSTHNLIKDGKKVGYISWAGKHMTIKLNTAALDEKKEKKLQAFLENLMNAEVSEV